MRTDLQRQLRELADTTNAHAAKLPAAEARAARAAALEQARELAAMRGRAELRLVNGTPLPPPGQTGMRRAGVRR